MLFVVFLSLLHPTAPFLLGVSIPTAPSGGNFITDDHYNALMDLFIQERQSRLNLERYVIQLNQRLLHVEKETIASKTEIEILKKSGVSVDLYEQLKNNSETINQNYQSLILDNRNLRHDFDALKHTNELLVTEVNGLKQLKPIAQLQNVEQLKNMTIHLEQEIQRTNNNVNLLVSEGNARKQDFVALVSDSSELRQQVSDLQRTVVTKLPELEKGQNSTSLSLVNLESKLNVTSSFLSGFETHLKPKIENMTDHMNEKVALTACLGGQSSISKDIITFSDIKTHYGVNDLSSFTQTGMFKCEKRGLYVFFANLGTTTQNSYFQWYRNTTPLSVIFFSYRSTFESGSGMVLVELEAGDTVSLKDVYGGATMHNYSCYSMFKLK